MFLPDGSITMNSMEAIQDDISKALEAKGSTNSFHVLPDIDPFCGRSSYANKRTRSRKRKSVFRRALALGIDVAAETLWPTRCAICDKPGEVICEACEEKIRYIDVLHACPICGSPYGAIQCSECNEVAMNAQGLDSFPFTRIASAVHIDDDTKRLVTLFKDHDEHRLASMLAETMCRYIDPSWYKDAEKHDELTITYIPSTKEALRRRGFDHMEKISMLIAANTELDLIDVFERPNSKDQRKLTRKQRAENMQQKFKIHDGATIRRRMMVVDDICTTGSTLFGAALSLKSAGCEEIYGLTFGKVC